MAYIDKELAEEPKAVLSMNPKKFALWLFIISIIMIFASQTSAYLVRRAEGNWLEVDFPPIFTVSTIVIILSSFTMQWAYHSAKRDELVKLKIAIIATTLLGFTFLVTQWLGWGQLVDMQVFFGGRGSNPGGSFVYVLSGLHAAHLIGGLIFLLIVTVKTFQYKIHAKSLQTIELCNTYWHFMDILWVYLFVFLLINR
jgi:cytochrome c oxidase subunit 3